MAVTRSNNTFIEGLANLNRSLADLEMTPDADGDLINQIRQLIISKARAPETMMQQAGLLPTSGQNPAGMAALGLGGLGPAGPGGLGGLGIGGPGGPGGPLPPGGPMPPDMLGMAPPPSFLGAGVPGMPPPGPPAPGPADLTALLGAGV